MRNFSVNFGLTQKYKTENFQCKAGQKKVVAKTKYFQGETHRTRSEAQPNRSTPASWEAQVFRI